MWQDSRRCLITGHCHAANATRGDACGHVNTNAVCKSPWKMFNKKRGADFCNIITSSFYFLFWVIMSHEIFSFFFFSMSRCAGGLFTLFFYGRYLGGKRSGFLQLLHPCLAFVSLILGSPLSPGVELNTKIEWQRSDSAPHASFFLVMRCVRDLQTNNAARHVPRKLTKLSAYVHMCICVCPWRVFFFKIGTIQDAKAKQNKTKTGFNFWKLGQNTNAIKSKSKKGVGFHIWF